MEVKCLKCGKKFKTESEYAIKCSNCKRKMGTNAYLVITIILVILGFLVGIIGGAVNSKEVIVSTGLYTTDVQKSFNAAYMFYTWIITFGGSLPLFAIYSICRRLDLIIDKK